MVLAILALHDCLVVGRKGDSEALLEMDALEHPQAKIVKDLSCMGVE